MALALLITALMLTLSFFEAKVTQGPIARASLLLTLALVLIFSRSNLLKFYLVFEISLVPIF